MRSSAERRSVSLSLESIAGYRTCYPQQALAASSGKQRQNQLCCRGLSDLLACPFCRQLFARLERTVCPECQLGLKPLAELPSSLEAEGLDPIFPASPEEQDLGWFYTARGRGPLLVLSVLGALVFVFAPWLEERAPDIQSFTGLQFARILPWIWGGGIGWVTLFALVLSRRTVYQMRSSRLAVAILATMILSTVALRLSLPVPAQPYLVRRFAWGWGLYGAGLLSMMALFYAWRFGGDPSDLVPQKPRAGGETLH